MFPNFLGIGAQKAGTTWLHTMLSSHRQVWLPPLKELHYFDRKFPIKSSDGIPNARPGQGVAQGHFSRRIRRLSLEKLRSNLRLRRLSDVAWELKYYFGDWDDTWYSSLFDGRPGRLVGEITPAYACLGAPAIGHVHGLMPDAKLILLLRDPIQRAWSHAKMDLAREAGRSPEHVELERYLAHVTGAGSRLRGDYVGALARWSDRFPESQLFVGFFDEIQQSPEVLLRRILAFLGVSASDDDIPANVGAPVNVGQEAEIPPPIQAALASLYIDQLRVLADRFGGYPNRWLGRCEAMLEGHASTDVSATSSM